MIFLSDLYNYKEWHKVSKPKSGERINIKTRNERVIAVESSTFVEKYHNEKAKEFIEFILERYKKDGVKELDEDKLSDLVKLSGFDRSELRQSFGNYNIRDEYFGLQREIYR